MFKLLLWDPPAASGAGRRRHLTQNINGDGVAGSTLTARSIWLSKETRVHAKPLVMSL